MLIILLRNALPEIAETIILRQLHNSQLFDNMQTVDQSRISTMSFDMTEKYRTSGFCSSSPYLAHLSRGRLHI